MPPSISVVIPAYNRAGLLPSTLDSICGQTAPADQVIVVDDGSTDHTAEVCAGYADRGVHYIRIRNSGDLVARNVGLRAATTDLVGFCDSDDLWNPDFLATVRELWRVDPGVQVCFSNFKRFGDDIWDERSKFDLAPRPFWRGLNSLAPGLAVFETSIADRLIQFQPFFPSCMVVDRAAFAAIGGWDERVSRIIGCDFATALRTVDRLKLGVIQAPLVGIRRHVSNISRNTEKMNLGDALVLEHVLATDASFTKWEAEIRQSAAQRRRDALDAAFARKDYEAVRTIYRLLPPGERRPKTILKAAILARLATYMAATGILTPSPSGG